MIQTFVSVYFLRKKLAKIATTISCYVLYIFFIGLTQVSLVSTDQVGDFCVVTLSSLSLPLSLSLFFLSLVLLLSLYVFFFVFSLLFLLCKNYFSLFFSLLSIHLSNFLCDFSLALFPTETDLEMFFLSHLFMVTFLQNAEFLNYSNRTLSEVTFNVNAYNPLLFAMPIIQTAYLFRD